MTVNPGAMRERVDVQNPFDQRNSIGEAIERWESVGTRWASVLSLSSREYLLAGQQQFEVTHRVRMRYAPSVTSRMRLIWRNRALQITSIVARRRLGEMELLCLEDTSFVPPPAPEPQPPEPETFTYLLTEDGLALTTETNELLLVD